MYTKLSQIFESEPLPVAVEAFQHWPGVVLYELRRSVLSHVFGADRTDMVPPLEELAERGRMPPAGMFSVGEWAMQRRRPRESIRRPFWVVIDWQVVFQSGPDVLTNVSSLPALALLWWGLYVNYVRRRALMPAELLTRQMMQAFGTAYNTTSLDPIRYPELTQREMEALQQFNNYVLNDGYILYALQATLRKNFSDYFKSPMLLGKSTTSQLRDLYYQSEFDAPIPKRLSAFCISKVINSNRQKFPGYEEAEITEEMEARGFTNLPTPENRRFYELAYIYSTTNAQDHGVHFYKYKPTALRTIQYAIIHAGQYAAHRTRTGCQTFVDFLKENEMAGRPVEKCGTQIVDWFRLRYPYMDYAVDYSKFIGLARSYFGDDTKQEELWIVPMKEIRQHMLKAHKVRAALRDPEKPRRTGRRPFVAESPEFDVAGGRKIRVRVLKWFGNFYFSPMDWEIPRQDTRRINRAGVEVPKQGVYVHVELEHEYYSLEFLKSVRFGGNFDYTEVYSWLEDFQHLTNRELGVYRQSSTYLERRHRAAATVPGGVTTPYHHDEDNVIMKYYHPDMGADERKWILEGCPGRTWDAIRRRARYLCYEMIDQGITDRSKLPHLRATTDMLKQLRKAVAKKSRESAKQTKEAGND